MAHSDEGTLAKGSLRHVHNTMLLGQVPTELYVECKEKVINSLPLAKDISVLENLKQALVSPHQHHWEQACLDELDLMKRQGLWQAIDRTPEMKTIGHCWVFNTKLDEYGNIKKFKRWKVCSFDVSGAYLYSPVEETVLMEPPTHFILSLRGKVLHLQKALYGMKQVGCYEAIIVIWIHVNNGVIASNSPIQIEEFCKALCNNFEIKWSDNMKQIVGLECAFGEGEVTILQTRLTNDIIEAHPRKIFQHDCPLPPIPKMTSDEQEAIMEATPFRLVIGLLAYLDCSLNLWGGKLERSQSGFMLKLGDAPILWGSKHQTVVVLSTCAAKYIALSDLMQHLVQVINQLTQLAQDFKKMIFCDNQAAVQVLIDNLSCKRMQYLNRAFFFVNNVIRKHGVMVKWVTTQEMQADALTKLLGQSLTQAL
ncbi:hypothetical protein O181_015388 [Austropuccinia psidii MF-1]|uniref:Reverse transcriptase Ty1/copia-type domain-containing protein n=1 Tax=Austropuccinia psidii MF-1 TaxID=1389203 RepID=A0A9Q3GPY2_9BASI|nr:hypothetical protein [Austropuccinia psidii MF-1]